MFGVYTLLIILRDENYFALRTGQKRSGFNFFAQIERFKGD